MTAKKPAMKVTKANFAAVADAAWAAAAQHQQFGYAEISSDLGISVEQATRIVRGWVKAGAIQPVAENSSNRNLWVVTPDFVWPAAVHRTPEENMWTVMRRFRSFSPSVVVAHSNTDLVEVKQAEAEAYCQALLAASYLTVERRAAPAMKREAIYRLTDETGPRPPVLRRVRAVVDQNTGEVRVLGGGA